MFTEFVIEITRIIEGAEAPDSWGQIIHREQLDPTGALDIIRAHYAPILEVGIEYISRLRNAPVEAPETRIQFLAILSMIKFIRADRGSVLKTTKWNALGEEETRIVECMLRHNMRALLAPREIRQEG